MVHIVSSFSYDTQLELAISKLEENGVAKDHIVAIPLDVRQGRAPFLDTIHRSDGLSIIDLACVLGLVFMLLGMIYGYVLPIGPVFLAFIGLAIGFGSGLLIKWLYLRKKLPKQESKVDVFLTIKCKTGQQEMIEKILWNHGAFGVGTKEE